MIETNLIFIDCMLAREELIAEWNRAAIQKYGSLDNAPLPKKRRLNEEIESEDGILRSHVALPSSDDIEKILLQKRKEELLRKYVGSS